MAVLIQKGDPYAEIKANTSRSYYWYLANVLEFAPYLHAPLHEEICRFVSTGWSETETKIKMLLIPRRHIKTGCSSIGLPTWIWTQDREDTLQLIHGKKDLAWEYLTELKDRIGPGSMPPEIWPEVFFQDPKNESPRWLKSRIDVRRSKTLKNPSLLATGMDASTTGLHCRWLILDDLVHRDNVGSPQQRLKVYDFIQKVLAQGQPGLRVLILGTRWHEDDAYGRLLDPHGLYAGKIELYHRGAWGEPGYIGKEDEIIFPLSESGKTGFTQESLMSIADGMQSYNFSCQFLNLPSLGTRDTFDRGKIHWFDLTPSGEIPYRGPVAFFTAVDPNRSDDPDADFGAVVTCGVCDDGSIWVVDLSWGHPSPTQLIDWIRSHVTRWNSETVYIEATGYQNQLQHWIREDQVRNRVVYPIHMVSRSHANRKTRRIGSLIGFVNAGGLHVLRGLDRPVAEMGMYGPDSPDDCLDCITDIYLLAGRPDPVEEDPAPKHPNILQGIVDEVLMEGPGIRRIGRYW